MRGECGVRTGGGGTGFVERLAQCCDAGCAAVHLPVAADPESPLATHLNLVFEYFESALQQRLRILNFSSAKLLVANAQRNNWPTNRAAARIMELVFSVAHQIDTRWCGASAAADATVLENYAATSQIFYSSSSAPGSRVGARAKCTTRMTSSSVTNSTSTVSICARNRTSSPVLRPRPAQTT